MQVAIVGIGSAIVAYKVILSSSFCLLRWCCPAYCPQCRPIPQKPQGIFADGFLDIDEANKIVELQAQMANIEKALATSDFDAQLKVMELQESVHIITVLLHNRVDLEIKGFPL